ncbi:hypothetical protein PIB30_070468 [Stylosanthes scabra]|uniref:Uncharacterized protein n=1 Tax=Stylosanthes scabra TaxID=79078 RepID=A0ABU6TQT9_9FABA|nr:hypothetical protein [Stylosanthes scabra]
MRPILPKICWNEIEEWEIEWEEIKARLNLKQEQQQQSQIIQETTQFQSSIEQEIQAKIEEDQEIKHKTASKDELEEALETLDQENFQTIQIHTNSVSQLHVEGEAGTLQNAIDKSVTRIIDQKQQKENEAELDEPGSGDDDLAGGFEDRHAGKWSELVRVVLVQRPPPETLDLNSHAVVEEEREPSALELEIREQRRHHHPTVAAVSTEKRRQTLFRSGGCGGGEVVAMPGSRPKALPLGRIFLLNPPPLISAVFPWDCNKSSVAAAGNDPEDGAFAKGKLEDVANIGNRIGLSEMHYRERDDFKSSGGAWRGTEGKHSRGAWMGVLVVREVVGVVVAGANVARRSGGHLELKGIPSISLFSSSDEGGQMEWSLGDSC